MSLATLYAAAAFIVCGVPLEDIFMILTPLHSQNFIDMQDGILTNNRRLVTKTMWFNGTEISDKAQRALRNEQVTVVAHNTGVIHCLYDDATIDPKAYEHFKGRLADYLSTALDMTVFASFLRSESRYQKYFQICRDCHGQPQFIRAELLYHYEHGSPFKIGDDTHDKLLAEVSDEDFVRFELPGRIRCDRLCDFLKQKIDVRRADGREAMRKFLAADDPRRREVRRRPDGLRAHRSRTCPRATRTSRTARPSRSRPTGTATRSSTTSARSAPTTPRPTWRSTPIATWKAATGGPS